MAAGIDVLALHVNHALSPHADDWQRRCEVQCERWAKKGLPVRFAAQRVDARPCRGESVEAWARKARYRALRDMALAGGASLILLAHHRRDQAETFVLQALRGAGVAGLSGMPALIEREGVTWARPWLGIEREAIERYVRRHRIAYVEDESNADVRYARNRLRHEVWPALTSAFPYAEGALADAAAWAQEAAACMHEWGEADVAALARGDALDVRRWSLLTPARRSNALRTWLRLRTDRAAPSALVLRLLSELKDGARGRWPIEGGELRAWRGALHYETETRAEDESVRPQPEPTLTIRRAGTYALPGWGGALRATRVKEGGVPLAWLQQLELRPRSGAEQFQAGMGRPPRSLKKQFQAAAVPVWERDGPLIYSGGHLVFVPGLGVDARVWGMRGQAMMSLEWVSENK
jgi:tRNA(Ile)-lysidine synthase